jgi:hypothetical protein
MSSGLRYKFQGSTLAVVTAFTGANVITAVTQSTTPVVTSAAHGYIVGDTVKITGVVGMTELNSNEYIISAVTTNTFTLYDTDTTAYTTYVSGGAAAKGTFSSFCELTGFDRSGGASADIPVSTICSTAEESEVGLKNYGTVKLDYNFAPSVVQTTFDTAQSDGSKIIIKRVLPQSAGSTIWKGLVLETGESAQVNDVWKGSASIKLTGAAFSFI